MIQAMLYFWHVNHVDFYLRGAMKCKKGCICLKSMERSSNQWWDNYLISSVAVKLRKVEPELIHYD